MWKLQAKQPERGFAGASQDSAGGAPHTVLTVSREFWGFGEAAGCQKAAWGGAAEAWERGFHEWRDKGSHRDVQGSLDTRIKRPQLRGRNQHSSHRDKKATRGQAAGARDLKEKSWWRDMALPLLLLDLSSHHLQQ